MANEGHNIANAQIKNYVERIESIESDMADLSEDKSELYKEIKGNGFDASIIRKLVAERKKARKNSVTYAEQLELFGIYAEACGDTDLIPGAGLRGTKPIERKSGPVNFEKEEPVDPPEAPEEEPTDQPDDGGDWDGEGEGEED